VAVFLPDCDLQKFNLIVLFSFNGKVHRVGGCIETVKDVGDVSLVGIVCYQNIINVTKVPQ
jgi:hypothetical protein